MTIRPEFFGTVPNFESLSRKNTTSFGTLNCPELRTPSRISADLTSRCVECQTVDQNAVHHFYFCLSEMRSVELKMHQIHFWPGLHPGPCWRSLQRSPRPPSWMGRAMPCPHNSPFQRLNLGILKSVPNFYHRFMVTLGENLFSDNTTIYQVDVTASTVLTAAEKGSSEFSVFLVVSVCQSLTQFCGTVM